MSQGKDRGIKPSKIEHSAASIILTFVPMTKDLLEVELKKLGSLRET